MGSSHNNLKKKAVTEVFAPAVTLSHQQEALRDTSEQWLLIGSSIKLVRFTTKMRQGGKDPRKVKYCISKLTMTHRLKELSTF